MDRLIGIHEGGLPGPALIVFGGVHGNEPAGVEALKILFEMLKREPHVNPGFEFRGKMIGVAANVAALAKEKRYISADLNRIWLAADIERIISSSPDELEAEDREVYELHTLLNQITARYCPEDLVFLDLHTTSADGGIFSIPADEKESLALSQMLTAPAVLDIMKNIDGALPAYALQGGFSRACSPQRIRALAFESGRHRDPLSVQRAVAAIVQCLRAIGCIRTEDVDGRHDAILKDYSKGLPRAVRMIYAHHIRPEDRFQMRPGYLNFQPISKGEIIADDADGAVLSKWDGRILMPLYQPLGVDGFFVVEEISPEEAG